MVRAIDWSFLKEKGLESPGREEAVRRVLEKTQAKKQIQAEETKKKTKKKKK